jgi:serine/threonine protein kinase
MSGYVSSLLGSVAEGVVEGVSNAAINAADATVTSVSGKVAKFTDSTKSIFGKGKFDKYERGPKIGNGASGIVYSCKNKETQEVYAWKEMKVTENATVEDLSYEYKTVEKLIGWPNTLHYYEGDERTYKTKDGKQDELYVVFICDLIKGYDLEKIIYSDAEITPEQIKWIMAQLLYGLSGLAEKEIVHFDIKPSNIMITDEFDLTIIDFGTALNIYRPQITSNKKRATQMGIAKFKSTFNYLSKEGIETHFKNQSKAINLAKKYMKNDIWASGCVLHELWKRNFLFKSIDEDDHIKKLEEFEEKTLKPKDPENIFAVDPANPTKDEKEVFEFFLFLMKNTDKVNKILEHEYIIDYVDYNKKKHNHPPKTKDSDDNDNDNGSGGDGLDVD